MDHAGHRYLIDANRFELINYGMSAIQYIAPVMAQWMAVIWNQIEKR